MPKTKSAAKQPKLRIRPRALTTRDIALADADAEITTGIQSQNQAQVTRGLRARKEALASPALCVCSDPGCAEEFEQGDELIVAVVSILKKTKQPDGSITTEWLLERDLDSPVSFAFCPHCMGNLPFITTD